MSEDPNRLKSADARAEDAKRRRVIFLFALANITVVGICFIVAVQPGVTLGMAILIAILSLLLINGAVWFGLRGFDQVRRRLGLSQPVACFAMAALTGADAVANWADGGFASVRLLGSITAFS